MKRILTGFVAFVLMLTLCTAVLTVSASAEGKAAVPTAESATSEQGTEMTFGDRFAKAGEVTLLGLGMVFAVLALLWGVLEIFRVVMKNSDKKKAASTAKQTAESPKTEPVSAPVTAVPAAEAANDDGELIAAITAAVAAYLASEGDAAYAGGFRVVSFRRSGNGSAWNKNN